MTSTISLSSQFVGDVLNLLPSTPSKGITAAFALKLLGYGSPPAMRNALRVLVETGAAAFIGEGNNRTYHRAAARQPAREFKQGDLGL